MPQMDLFQFFNSMSSGQRSRKSAVVAEDKPFMWKDLWIHWKTRPYYRHMNVKVLVDGKIVLTTAKKMNEKLLFKFLEEYEDWIRKQLYTFQIKWKNVGIPKIQEGASLLFKGKKFELLWIKESRQKNIVQIDERKEQITVYSLTWEPFQLHIEILKAFQKRARVYLEQRTKYFAERMELYPNKLSYRAQNTRWGSCNNEGNISLNWKLIAAPNLYSDYVIVHELSHLKHMNHSKDFWDLVASQIPDFKTRQAWLNRNHLEFEFLNKDSCLFSRHSNIVF